MFRTTCFIIFFIMIFSYAFAQQAGNEKNKTVALWLFDEQVGLYPSMVLEDQTENNFPLVLGLGGKIAEGKFGNALYAIDQERIEIPHGEIEFGLDKIPVPEGRTVKPLIWFNAKFCALMTSGENHLRKEIGFRKPTDSKLNLGDYDWTVEFWFMPQRQTKSDGVIFEIGTGPRGENNVITQLKMSKDKSEFVFVNQPSDAEVSIKTKLNDDKWSHLAFCYNAASNIITHFVNGVKVSEVKHEIKSLPEGDEDYMTLGRNALWQNPMQGKIDELRFSDGIVYQSDFTPPSSFAKSYSEELIAGPPLLFSDETLPLKLGGRKHLFIDDTLLAVKHDVEFVVNPPRKEEIVLTNIEGPFRKHLTVVEDEDGLIRIYNSAQNDYLQVFVSKDGIHFEAPKISKEYKGKTNFVIKAPVGGLGNPFIDPNGKGETKWKYITGYYSRGTYLFTSPDGYNWEKVTPALIPFRNGTQSCTFYDDQQQEYIAYHRTGIHHSPGLVTERASVVTRTGDLFTPIKYKPLSQSDYRNIDKKKRIREPLPWWLDNGPLTPGDWGLEFPVRFQPDIEDPIGTDIYITKAIKYPWAPDTYIAFPIVFFHYEEDGPVTRTELMNPERLRGEGPIETQIAVSRDGLNWKRYYRPAYIGIGEHGGLNMVTAYIAHGMIKRGNEIWQYYFGEPHYHSAYQKFDDKRAVFRLVQRIDGFISLDSPYDKEAFVITKPFVFEGNRLILNIDTDAAGYTQVGFLDENDNPIEGFTVDDCVYINGDFVDTEVEWMQNREEIDKLAKENLENLEALVDKVITTKDVSMLQGKTVKLIFRMRGTKLYAMQFVNK